jgi:hypothetical protein
MAIRRSKLEYTVYSPNYVPGIGTCWNCKTFVQARRCAKRLGIGAKVFRDVQRTNKKGQELGVWFGIRAFLWTGKEFKRVPLVADEV